MSINFKPLPACLSQAQRDYLWGYVAKLLPHECWYWTGKLSEHGYPIAWVRDIAYCGTRLAYLDYFGEQPGEMMVCHTCDHPSCMNPHHFFLGSHQDNMDDKVAKCRQMKGRDHHLCKLNEQQVLEIFAKKGQQTSIELAAQYGVSKTAVKAIWTGRNWSHLTGKVHPCKLSD